MMHKSLPIIGFAAFSGTGKTSLLKKLIPVLKQKNIRVAVIKHAHHDFEIDLPGKDSYELRHAGADQVLISSSKRFVKILEVENELSLQECLARVTTSECDLVLVEGYKMATINKIELHRPSLGFPLLHNSDKHIIAIASDEKLDPEKSTRNDELSILDLNNVEEIADFIISIKDKLTSSIS